MRDSNRLAPKQQRSRESREKLINATERLLISRGDVDFSLADVSGQSGISIGGIYRRFESKESLVRAVQERLYERMDAEARQLEREASQAGGSLTNRLPVLVSGFANLLREHAPLLKAIVEATWSDPIAARHGMAAYQAHAIRFRMLLLDHRAEIKHEDPEHAANFCHSCTFELVASHFGFGRRSSSSKSSWPALVSDIQRLCFSFLMTSVPGGATAQRRRLTAGRR